MTVTDDASAELDERLRALGDQQRELRASMSVMAGVLVRLTGRSTPGVIPEPCRPHLRLVAGAKANSARH